ncbi:hypothetical protein [Curtobacterium luteum]|uniref:hypothetical protein n=1 Tax=Curtobacterium luteum TaxID=33881 RepID=UPI0038116890
MTDTTTTDTPEPTPAYVYPDTPVGSLMRERDSALSSARNTRSQCEQLEQLAQAADARAASLQTAIDSLGGEPTPGMSPAADRLDA